MVDFNCHYLVPMSKVSDSENVESLVECTIKQGHKPFEMVCVCEGYRSKGFYTEYFEYLIKTGYAKKIDRFVTYFEATYANTLAGFTCVRASSYMEKLTELAREYPELELVYRQWSDGTIENGIIEKENWSI
jgi:hypothetical protein